MEYFPQAIASSKDSVLSQTYDESQRNVPYSNEHVLQLTQLNTVRSRIPELINRLPNINVKYQSEMLMIGEVITILRMLNDLMEIK